MFDDDDPWACLGGAAPAKPAPIVDVPKPPGSLDSLDTCTMEELAQWAAPKKTTLLDPSDVEANIELVRSSYPDASAEVLMDLLSRAAPGFADRLDSLTKGRNRTVAAMFLQRGSLTNKDLEAEGLADFAMREFFMCGFQRIKTNVVRNERRVKEFRIDPTLLHTAKKRESLNKAEIKAMFGFHKHRCAECDLRFSPDELVADHRIPVDRAGATETKKYGRAAYQPLCKPCNGRKQSYCTNECDNEDPEVCRTCRLAYPATHEHLATRPLRSLTLSVDDPDGIDALDAIRNLANETGVSCQEIIKRHLPLIIDAIRNSSGVAAE